ncbi:nucleoid-associated protein [Shewanella algidipiscicola]|uniref:nucleoid-associated protein n=1 Tax=Shewanella algidipiscicola TaxID=614070 RepID=UPI000D784E71|nr:nucleoid-associated protein [Shewanella algidipiscicola]
MAINHVIIHEVKRDEDGEAVSENLRSTENNAVGLAGSLTDSLITLFSHSTLNIGEFAVDGDNSLIPPFEQGIKNHYQNLNCRDFVEMTRRMASRYAQIMRRPNLQSVKGGLLVFYEYESYGKTWLALAVLQRSEGYNASPTLELEPSQIIDINKLHLGAAINLTDWEEDLSNRYIKFKTGTAAEVRDYFEEYIGCQRDKQAAILETKNLKKAVQDYAQNSLNLSEVDTQQKIDDAHGFIKEKLQSGKEVKLSDLANRVFPESPDDFLTVARNTYDVGEEIAISNAELKKYLRISGKAGGVSISFDRNLLGSQVIYSDDCKLTFNEIPATLKAEITEELNSRRQSN